MDNEELELQRLKQENELKKIQNEELYADLAISNKKLSEYKQALEEIREIAKFHQYFNPEILEIKGDIGQLQDLKMTEIYEKCNEVSGNE